MFVCAAGAGPVQSVVQDTWARIEPLSPYTYYSFYVVAYSGRDQSDPSAVITVRTEEDGRLDIVFFYYMLKL